MLQVFSVSRALFIPDQSFYYDYIDDVFTEFFLPILGVTIKEVNAYFGNFSRQAYVQYTNRTLSPRPFERYYLNMGLSRKIIRKRATFYIHAQNRCSVCTVLFYDFSKYSRNMRLLQNLKAKIGSELPYNQSPLITYRSSLDSHAFWLFFFCNTLYSISTLLVWIKTQAGNLQTPTFPNWDCSNNLLAGLKLIQTLIRRLKDVLLQQRFSCQVIRF